MIWFDFSGVPLPVHILAAARTPLGAFGGSLKGLEASALAAHALRETLRRSGLEATRIEQVILGCAFPGGGNPARAAALAAGLPAAIPAFTPCMGAASGLKAVALAAQNLSEGSGLILAGGADSLSRVPYVAPSARWGVRMGEATLLDGLLLESPAVDQEAEALASTHGISMEALRAWTEGSRRRAAESAAFRHAEIAPLEFTTRKGTRLLVEDEPPESSRIPQMMGLAAPADGAAAVLLGSGGHPGDGQPQGRILGWVESGEGWATAIRQLLRQTGLRFDAVDRWELHEPSAAHVLALLDELREVHPDRVNVRGGALALGDAPGASGVRLLLTLLNTLHAEGLQTGVVALPAGHGLGLAMAITRS